MATRYVMSKPLELPPNAIVTKPIEYFDKDYCRHCIKRGEAIFVDPIERLGCVGRDLFQIECDEYQMIA
jgi:hypothetical protein